MKDNQPIGCLLLLTLALACLVAMLAYLTLTRFERLEAAQGLRWQGTKHPYVRVGERP